MAIQTLNNGDLAKTQREKINSNFSEINTSMENISEEIDDANDNITAIKQTLTEMDNGNKYIPKSTVKKITTGTSIPETLEDGELYFQIF